MPEEGAGAAGDGGEEQQHEDQRDQAADVAERPARAGDPPDLPARPEAGQHGVDEDLAELRADKGDDVDREHHRGVRHPRLRQPEAEAAEHERHREAEDPALARPGAVGHGAEQRRQHRHRRPADRRRGAPERLAADRVADHLGDEPGREDEGDDQGLERLVRPVEQHPGEDAAAVDRVDGGGGRHTPDHRRPRPARLGGAPGLHPVGQGCSASPGRRPPPSPDRSGRCRRHRSPRRGAGPPTAPRRSGTSPGSRRGSARRGR